MPTPGAQSVLAPPPAPPLPPAVTNEERFRDAGIFSSPIENPLT